MNPFTVNVRNETVFCIHTYNIYAERKICTCVLLMYVQWFQSDRGQKVLSHLETNLLYPHAHAVSICTAGEQKNPPPLKKQQEVSNRHSYLPSRHPGQDRCSSSLSLVPYSSDPSSSSSFLSICLRPPPFLLTHQRCVTEAPLLISSTYVLWPDLGAL